MFRNSTEYLKSITDHTADALITIDHQGIIKSTNPACDKMFGYAPDELIGQNIKCLMPKKIANKHDDYLAQYLKTGEEHIIGKGRYLEALHQDGTGVPIHLSVSRIDLDGQIYFSGVIQSEGAVVEKADYLEWQRQRIWLEQAEKQANIGHWHVNLITNEVFWSDEIYNIHGVKKGVYEPELDKAISFYHPDDRDIVRQHIEKAVIEKSDFEFNLRIIQPNGALRHVNSSGTIEIDNDDIPIGIFGIFRDVTEETRISEERLQQQKFLELIMESMPDPIFVKDEDFKILAANSAFIGLYPKEKQSQIIGYTTIEDYNPAQAEEFLKEDKRAFKDGYSEVHETIDFPDGKTRTFLTKKVRFEAAGEKYNILGVVRDVTDLLQTQSELERSNKDLEDFAFTVSHDLKAPMRHISMASSFLDQSLHEKLSDEENDLVKIMIDGATKAQSMIENLLDYSRIGQSAGDNQPTDLNIVLNNVINVLAFEVEESEAEIKVENLPTILGNESLLMRLFQNLIENSLKYAKKDVAPHISISAQQIGTEYHITVRDNGIGIKPEFAEKIFKIFQRLHGESAEYEGLGIGLAICKKIMVAHNGDISLEASVEHGTGFVLSFPVS